MKKRHDVTHTVHRLLKITIEQQKMLDNGEISLVNEKTGNRFQWMSLAGKNREHKYCTYCMITRKETFGENN